MIMRLTFGPTCRSEAMGFSFVFHHYSFFPPLGCHAHGFGHCTKIPLSLMAAFWTVVERALHGRGVWGSFHDLA
jgi:hypothetical protein